MGPFGIFWEKLPLRAFNHYNRVTWTHLQHRFIRLPFPSPADGIKLQGALCGISGDKLFAAG